VILGLGRGKSSRNRTCEGSNTFKPLFHPGLNVTLHIANSIPSATLTNTTVQDNSPDITYSGSWTEQSGPNFSGGTSHYTQGPGNAFEYSFTGEHRPFFHTHIAFDPSLRMT
jgi:hypothetical protein